MKDSTVPQRTCIACRQVRPQAELLRLARDGDGQIIMDARRRLPGRGAYACPTIGCVEQALSAGRLARALKGAVKPPREDARAILESWRRR